MVRGVGGDPCEAGAMGSRYRLAPRQDDLRYAEKRCPNDMDCQQTHGLNTITRWECHSNTSLYQFKMDTNAEYQ